MLPSALAACNCYSEMRRNISGFTRHLRTHTHPRSVGVGSKALLSGGPKSAGPNSVAFSTWGGISA